MKVYISQLMINDTYSDSLSKEHLIEKLERAIEILSKEGHTVIHRVYPYCEDSATIKNSPLFHLSKSFEMISREADLVYFMEGWNKARGCIMEHMACALYGVPVRYEKSSTVEQ